MVENQGIGSRKRDDAWHFEQWIHLQFARASDKQSNQASRGSEKKNVAATLAQPRLDPGR